MRRFQVLVLFALLPAIALLMSGCPGGDPSVVGLWEISVWNGSCQGDPAYTVIASFDEGGTGAFGNGALQWSQVGRDVQFLAGTVPPTILLQFEGALVGRNRMAGTHANGTGCWEALRN